MLTELITSGWATVKGLGLLTLIIAVGSIVTIALGWLHYRLSDRVQITNNEEEK